MSVSSASRHPLLEGRRSRPMPPASGDQSELLADHAFLAGVGPVLAPPPFDRVPDERSNEERPHGIPSAAAFAGATKRPTVALNALGSVAATPFAAHAPRSTNVSPAPLFRPSRSPPASAPTRCAVRRPKCTACPPSVVGEVAELLLSARGPTLERARRARRPTPALARDAERGMQGGQIAGPRREVRGAPDVLALTPDRPPSGLTSQGEPDVEEHFPQVNQRRRW